MNGIHRTCAPLPLILIIRAIKKDSHSFRITCDMCTVSLLESREQCYIKAIYNNNISGRNLHECLIPSGIRLLIDPLPSFSFCPSSFLALSLPTTLVCFLSFCYCQSQSGSVLPLSSMGLWDRIRHRCVHHLQHRGSANALHVQDLLPAASAVSRCHGSWHSGCHRSASTHPRGTHVT